MESEETEKHPYRLATIVWLAFKSLPILVAGMTIILGYKLFILGVTGEASIVINVKDVGGQLINAAPGLFFAVGGIIALIVAIWKGGSVRFFSRGSRMARETEGETFERGSFELRKPK